MVVVGGVEVGGGGCVVEGAGSCGHLDIDRMIIHDDNPI